jgi:hypothetical protein
MDPHYEPKTTAGKIKIGDNILEKPGEDELPAHEPLAEPVKHEANPYAVTQAFQTGLPGVNK